MDGLEILILSEVSQTKTNIIWYLFYVESKKKWYKRTYVQNTNRLTDIENKLMVTKGERWVGGINQEFGIKMYTIYKTDNQQGPTV